MLIDTLCLCASWPRQSTSCDFTANSVHRVFFCTLTPLLCLELCVFGELWKRPLLSSVYHCWRLCLYLWLQLWM